MNTYKTRRHLCPKQGNNIDTNFSTPGGTPGGTPLYKPHRSVPAHRVWFSRFGVKTGIDFVHFGLESGMVFEETRRMYEHICRKKGQDLENRAVHPHQEFLGVPPGQH